jgi:hypothetical protein
MVRSVAPKVIDMDGVKKVWGGGAVFRGLRSRQFVSCLLSGTVQPGTGGFSTLRSANSGRLGGLPPFPETLRLREKLIENGELKLKHTIKNSLDF